jgi:hypothetical protein
MNRMDERFDCRATAAVLRSGSTVALSGHAAALLCAFIKPGAWWPLVAWCALVYFAVRVELDARLFQLLAESPSESPSESRDAGMLDQWMAAAGLRKNAGPRTLKDRRRGAIRLWRALLAALVVEIVMVIGALLWSPR